MIEQGGQRTLSREQFEHAALIMSFDEDNVYATKSFEEMDYNSDGKIDYTDFRAFKGAPE